MEANELSERFRSSVAHRPPSTIDIDQLVEHGQRSMLRRRVVGIGAATVLVATVAGLSTILPEFGTATERPPVAQVPKAPAKES